MLIRHRPAPGTGFPSPRGVNAAAFQGASYNYYLTSTGNPAAASNQKRCTFSFWIHRTLVSAWRQHILWACSRQDAQIQINDERIRVYIGSSSVDVRWDVLLEDTTDWYHIVLAFNTNAGTAAERIKLYINGRQAARIHTGTWPAQGLNLDFLDGTATHRIGAHHSTPSTSNTADLRMFDFTLVPSYTLEATHFGELVDASWIPLTNPQGITTWENGAYRLQFNNAGDMGEDTKPEGTAQPFANNGVIQFADNPMDAVCLLDDNTPPRTGNPGSFYFDHEARRCGTRHNRTGTIKRFNPGTLLLPSTVKWMVECTMEVASTTIYVGFAEARVLDNSDPGYFLHGFMNLGSGGGQINDTALPAGVRTWGSKWNLVQPDTACVGIDPDTKELVLVAPDNTVYREAWPGMPSDVVFVLWDDPTGFSNQRSIVMNFGESAKVRTWPEGFVECRKGNIPWDTYPTVPADVFRSTPERTGNDTSQAIELPFDDGMRVTKRLINGTANWIETSTVRGTNPGDGLFYRTEWSTSVAEYTNANGDLRPESPGTNVSGTSGALNASGDTYLDLAFRLSLELGWIQLLEPGTGANIVLPHGLGELPWVAMLKNIDRSSNWHLAHADARDDYADAMSRYVRLNSPNALSSPLTTMFYQTPDATNLYISATDPNINPSGGDRILVWVMPRFRRGVFRTGFYYGVNDESPSRSRGPVLKFDGVLDTLIVKKTTGTQEWGIISRGNNPWNWGGRSLKFTSAAEGSHDVRRIHGARMMDGDGVGASSSGNQFNHSGQRYIYMAWLEQHMKHARAA